MSRRISYRTIAMLKSQTNALQIVTRLLRKGALTPNEAAIELERIQINLYHISKSPKRSTL